MTTTSTSTPSVSCDHPDEDIMRTDPGRLSRDPEDAMGNDKCCPDAPTEPPDIPASKGTRGQGSREGDEAEVSKLRTSRAIEEGPSEVDNEEC